MYTHCIQCRDDFNRNRKSNSDHHLVYRKPNKQAVNWAFHQRQDICFSKALNVHTHKTQKLSHRWYLFCWALFQFWCFQMFSGVTVPKTFQESVLERVTKCNLSDLMLIYKIIQLHLFFSLFWLWDLSKYGQKVCLNGPVLQKMFSFWILCRQSTPVSHQFLVILWLKLRLLSLLITYSFVFLMI